MSQKHQIQIHHHHRLDFNACFQVLYFPSTSLLCKLESGFVITYLCIQLGSITHIHISHIYIQLDIQLDTLSVSAVARLQCCFLNQGSWSHIHIQLTNTHTPQFTHFFAPHFRITPKTSNLTPSQCRSKPDWSGVAPHLPALLPQSYQHPLSLHSCSPAPETILVCTSQGYVSSSCDISDPTLLVAIADWLSEHQQLSSIATGCSCSVVRYY